MSASRRKGNIRKNIKILLYRLNTANFTKDTVYLIYFVSLYRNKEVNLLFKLINSVIQNFYFIETNSNNT